MSKYHTPLVCDTFYHIFNRATGKEKLFVEADNYYFFLQKFKYHIQPIADTYCWCLLPNHFHFLVRIKQEQFVKDAFVVVKKKEPASYAELQDFLMERFANCCNSYTKAFNKKYARKGSLFIDYLKRVPIDNDHQLLSTIFYIHKNPVHHGLCSEIDAWQWSSYKTFFSTAATNVKRNEVLQSFQGIRNFEQFHRQPIYLKDAAVVE